MVALNVVLELVRVRLGPANLRVNDEHEFLSSGRFAVGSGAVGTIKVFIILVLLNIIFLLATIDILVFNRGCIRLIILKIPLQLFHQSRVLVVRSKGATIRGCPLLIDFLRGLVLVIRILLRFLIRVIGQLLDVVEGFFGVSKVISKLSSSDHLRQARKVLADEV